MTNKIICPEKITDEDIEVFKDEMMKSGSINEYKDLVMLYSLVADIDVMAISIKSVLDDNEEW